MKIGTFQLLTIRIDGFLRAMLLTPGDEFPLKYQRDASSNEELERIRAACLLLASVCEAELSNREH